jgi:hypothetical protein
VASSIEQRIDGSPTPAAPCGPIVVAVEAVQQRQRAAGLLDGALEARVGPIGRAGLRVADTDADRARESLDRVRGAVDADGRRAGAQRQADRRANRQSPDAMSGRCVVDGLMFSS